MSGKNQIKIIKKDSKNYKSLSCIKSKLNYGKNKIELEDKFLENIINNKGTFIC